MLTIELADFARLELFLSMAPSKVIPRIEKEICKLILSTLIRKRSLEEEE